MMNLLDEVDKIKKDGYSEANAEAKLCQDIIIKAISKSIVLMYASKRTLPAC